MYRAVAVLLVVVGCASAVPLHMSEGEAPLRERRFAPNGRFPFSMGNLPNLGSALHGPQGMDAIMKKLTGQSLEQTLSNVMGRNVNLQQLIAQVSNDTSGGDPMTKVAEKLFGRQAVARAQAQIDQMKTMMNSTSGRAELRNRMDQMMRSAGFPPSGSLASAFNNGPASVQNLFNPPGNGGVRMPSAQDPAVVANGNSGLGRRSPAAP